MGHQALQMRIESNGIDALEAAGALGETRPRVRLHEGSEHQQHRIRQQRVGLIGAQHPVHHLLAIAAAAGGGEQVGAFDDFQIRQVLRGADLARQVAGIDGLAPGIFAQAHIFQGIANLRQTIDPEFVV